MRDLPTNHPEGVPATRGQTLMILGTGPLIILCLVVTVLLLTR